MQGRRVGALALAVAIVAAACADDGPPVTDPEATPPPATTGPPATTAADGPTTSAGSASTVPGGESPTTTPATVAASTVPEPADPDALREPLTNADGENEALSGVGRLDGLGPSCTAFLLDVGPPSGPAYAMTNGHCVGIGDATTVLRDAPADGATVQFRLFADTPTAVAEVPVQAVRYATMRGTDVAVLELAATRSDVIGLRSYRLGPMPDEGDEVRVVGVPVDRVPDDEQVLRGTSCTAGATTRLVELEWLWDDAVSTDCGGVRGGSSGSPVFAGPSTAPRVHAILNTSTIGATDGTTCALGEPCEVTAAGASMVPDRTYAMPVEAWEGCFTPTWDPDAPGCPTETAPTIADAAGRDVAPGATWAATIGGGAGGPYVTKAGPVGITDCREAAGYAATAPAFDGPIGDVPGVHVLCAASLDAAQRPDTDQAGSAVVVVGAP